jgi:predicted nucleotidyltransferase
MVQPLEILGSEGALRILEIFLKEPGSEFSQADVCRKSGISRMTAMKWLRILREEGMLSQLSRGRAAYYKLNTGNPVMKQLKILITIAKLYGVLRKLKDEKAEFYLFGSAAMGEDTERSDIDLLVLGKVDKPAVLATIDDAGRIMKRDVKPMFLSHLDYSNISRKDRAFYDSVERSKIRII